MVTKNLEKNKHLETAIMKVGKFWIDFVNLRAEEYAENNHIPDLMRIGTPEEDAFRRDLTINKISQYKESMIGGIVSTPLHPLTTLLDDPLRVLRSIRFATRLRFTMDTSLLSAVRNIKVREALSVKVSRERIGGELDLILRSPDPVGAMRLLVNLRLAGTVFPLDDSISSGMKKDALVLVLMQEGLRLLSTIYDHLCDYKLSPPTWCQIKSSSMNNDETKVNNEELMLKDDEESRRILWYSAFLKPLRD